MPKAPRICSHPGCPTVVRGRRHCDRHTREALGRPSSTQRGYGSAHRRLRAQWAPTVATGTVRCWRCGKPISAGQAWDLGHDDDNRDVYRGPEHADCNRGAPHRGRG